MGGARCPGTVAPAQACRACRSGARASAGGDGSASGTSVEEALSSTAATAVAAITPSVVNIDTVVDYGVGQAAGTGIVLSADGLVLTNHHVVKA